MKVVLLLTALYSVAAYRSRIFQSMSVILTPSRNSLLSSSIGLFFFSDLFACEKV